MRIQYMSDLHMELYDNSRYIKANEFEVVGDVLVLAGDTFYLRDIVAPQEKFWNWASENFRQVLLVPGNHEFYGGYDIAQTIEDYEFQYRPNVRYINNKSVMLGEVELFFTTLWTRINPVFLWKVQRGMNDFRYGVLDGKRFCANDVDILHRRCVDWLRTALEASSAKTEVRYAIHIPAR